MLKVGDSERLSYALMGADDAGLLFELDQDVEVMRYINGGKMTSMNDIHTVFLPRMASYTNAKKGWGLWKAVANESDGESDEFIGWILVRPMDFFSDSPQFDNLELGWRFKRSAWGKGFGTEAARHIMQNIIAASQAVNTFSAIALPENIGSINIMKKLGMRYVKTELHQDPLGDEVLEYYEIST